MVISIYSHKGGTGKTTTTINLGRVLKDKGYHVLLVDMDAQANLTYSLGVQKTDVQSVNLSPESIITTQEGLDILPNYTTPQFLIDYEFPSVNALHTELGSCFANYDFVLIDCPPAMDMSVVNALLASDGIIFPVLLDVLSLEALNQAVSAINMLFNTHSHAVQFKYVLPVMVNPRRLLTAEVKKYIKGSFDLPVFENTIRMNVKTAEAPSHGVSVLEYAPNSNGAKDYTKATDEFLNYIEGNSL